MKFSHYVENLLENGYREIGYFTGIRVFLGSHMLITVDEYSGGFQVTFDSVKHNIGCAYYVSSEKQLCQLIGEMLNEN